jgi:hypothetical protein
MASTSRPVSVTPTQVAGLLSRGVDAEEIARLLVATGAWSDAGAEEIVVTLASSCDGAEPSTSMQMDDLEWPGPIDEPPPMFAA